MLGLIAVTDHDWFEFLRAQGPLDEVNFWRPSDKRVPRQLASGTPVLFKLENAVQGKSYDLSSGEGARVWDECRFQGTARGRAADQPESIPRYGEPVLVRPRLGQGTFRLAVTGAYGRACAITMEHSLPVLEAAHIKPYSEDGTHDVPNGLLLRSDIHRLFDMGYVSVSPEHRFHVSKRLKADFENGRSYYPLDRRILQLPRDRADQPDSHMLAWHFEERFRR